MKQLLFLLVLTPFFLVPDVWAVTSSKESIATKDKGFITCVGGASLPLFKQACEELTLDRVSFGANVSYEGTCVDIGTKKFIFSCSNFVFEPDKLAPSRKPYFEQ